MEILYGILIAALCVASAFGGFILCMKVRRPATIKRIYPLGDDKEVKDIRDRAFNSAVSIEKPPNTPSEYAQRFQRPASEELKRGTRPS